MRLICSDKQRANPAMIMHCLQREHGSMRLHEVKAVRVHLVAHTSLSPGLMTSPTPCTQHGFLLCSTLLQTSRLKIWWGPS